MRGKMIVCLSVLLSLLLPVMAGAWSSGIGGLYEHHQKLVERAEQCIRLPRPPQKSCEKPVDKDLMKALKQGSAEPDWDNGKGGDGLNSPKHSYNPDYPANKNRYDQAITNKFGYLPSEITAGDAIITIFGDEQHGIVGEIQKTKDLLNSLKCGSDQNMYTDLWRQFGRLSHYPADLASPLHAYSVGINGEYHEGYMDAEGKWRLGLWDVPGGRAMHGGLEVDMGEYAFKSLGCSSLLPYEVAKRARDAMKNYKSIVPFSDKTGYEGLMNDYAWAIPNSLFFIGIGPQQAQDALGGISSSWQEALAGFTAPSGCGTPPGGCGDCGGGNCSPPGGDHPDDNYSVSPLSFASPSSDELLEQTWDKLAVKKNRKSLLWFWMQSYLNGEYRLGNIDEAAYQSRAQSYGLTSDVAWELFHNDYITTPDVAILGRGFALSMSDLLQNKFNEPVRRFTPEDFSPDALKDYPVFIIPSGGLMGLENSAVFKASLDEYVKQGGTLIVFGQQHGYEFSSQNGGIL